MDTVRISREDLEGLITGAYVAKAVLTASPDLFWEIAENITDEELEVSISNFTVED